MTSQTRLERQLPDLLGELSAGPNPDYLDDVFARTARIRQRPAWMHPERWLPMAEITGSRAFSAAPPMRAIVVALVVAALVVAGIIVVGSQRPRVPAPFGPAANGLITYDIAGDIYVGDPDTGERRLVVGGTETDVFPTFSNDGTLLAFLREDPENCCIPQHIMLVRPDGSELRQVTATSIASIEWFQWTPDGTGLAIIHPDDGGSRLDVVNLAGDVTRLAPGLEVTSVAYRPPLGDELVVRAIEDGQLGLYTVRADGSDVRRLARSTQPPDSDLEYGGAVWSADGARIFYQSWAPVPADEAWCCQLWVMNADGSSPHQFPDERTGDAWEGESAVSPDGEWVAFWRVGEEARVSVVRSDGTGPVTPVGPVMQGLGDWVWAPDSSKILLVPQDPVDGTSPYLLDPTGGPWTPVTWEATTYPEWQRKAN